MFNVGGTEPIAHRDLVAMLIEEAGRGSVRFVEWPDEKRRIDIGSFYSDSSKFTRATGWPPAVDLREGFGRTLAYYREHFEQLRRRRRRSRDVMSRRVPFMSLTPGPDDAAVREAIDRVIARGWFILGPEARRRSKTEFAAASGARARRRRRHRHRRDRARRCARSASVRATK